MPLKLNVGCGRNILDGYINIDREHNDGVDVAADLDGKFVYLQFQDDSVDEFLLSHFLEHIHNTLPLMAELHRIAKPGAKMIIRCPHGGSDDAYEDPTHVRQYFPNSFGYFSQPFYWRADYGYHGDWRTNKVTLIIAKANSQLMAQGKEKMLAFIATYRNIVTEMVAELEAVKPIRECRRELQEPLDLEVVAE